MQEIEKNRKRIPINIGMTSLIGVHGIPPFSWGNYFWLVDGGRVLNFWEENLIAANQQFNLGGEVDIIYFEGNPEERYKGYCIIDDKRIPQDWYYNKLCFTGTYRPSKEIAKIIYDYLGDPDNEFEQFINPENYYLRRGGIYRSNSILYSKEARQKGIEEFGDNYLGRKD